jgi:conserved oligomeric Golgi complex subunit 2
MTNRPPPERPSAFVKGVLRPLKDFSSQWGERAPADVSATWQSAVLLHVTEKYLEAMRELLVTARQMEDALKKRRGGRAVTRRGSTLGAADGAAATAAANLSDTDKIVMQLLLDAQEFGRELTALGLDTAACEPYQAMLAEVSDTSAVAAQHLLTAQGSER